MPLIVCVIAPPRQCRDHEKDVDPGRDAGGDGEPRKAHIAELTQAEYDQLQVDKGLAILVTPSGTEFKGRVASEPTERKPGYFDALFHTVDPT